MGASVEPAYEGYFADPFLLSTSEGYVAYGTGPASDGPAFRALVSPDLHSWSSAGTVFTGDPSIGTDCWAPEVIEADGAWWMYYSAGNGIAGHHLRVARADCPLGPFTDLGKNLTPDEPFAIDPHPFLDTDGSRYLFYAHDVLTAERPGTHLAVRRMVSLTELGPDIVPVLEPNATWQRYEADRRMYGRQLDWYTLEGPTVVNRGDTYVLLYSGGSWEGPDYGVSYATAPAPLGPWAHPDADIPLVLSRVLTGQRGPGHNSVLDHSDSTVIAYHAWNDQGTERQMHIAPLRWDRTVPSVDAPGPVTTTR